MHELPMNGHLQCHLCVLNRITINLGSNEVEQNKEVLQIYASVHYWHIKQQFHLAVDTDVI